MLVKAFSRISTKPVSTMSNVVVAHSQLLPHQPCRKRSGAAESPTLEPPASTHTTPQPHHHGSTRTIATTRRRGGAPTSTSPRLLLARSTPLSSTTPGRHSPERPEAVATSPGHRRPAIPQPPRPWPRHPLAAKARFRQSLPVAAPSWP
jgi:hypothetical protein